MEPEQVVELQRETRSSIEVSRTAKGEPTWHIKKYYADGEEEAALAHLRAIEIALRQFYLEGGAERMQEQAQALADGADPELLAKLEQSLAERRKP